LLHLDYKTPHAKFELNRSPSLGGTAGPQSLNIKIIFNLILKLFAVQFFGCKWFCCVQKGYT